MSYYEKFVSYIDLFEHGEKVKNIGFVKSEIRENAWKVKVNIRGLQKTDTIMCEMKTVGSEEFMDRFQIVKGEGQFEKIYEMGDLERRGYPYSSIQGLIFQIAGHRYGKCIWKHRTENLSEKPERPTESVLKGARLSEEAVEQYRAIDIQKRENPEKEDLEKQDLGKQRKDVYAAKLSNEVANSRVQEQEKQSAQEQELHMTLPEYGGNQLSGDKWKQLGRMYPAIHPFHEKEKGEYISIKPKDFVILYEKFQTLVNNSFLLHGYFNYRHIILGRRKAGEKARYVIGVPGVFYEREKMVAVMFGFEEFEGVDSEKTGAFGYYMREVQI